MKPSRLAAASLLALAAVPALSADATGAGGPLRDGNWAGSLSMGATIDFSSGTIKVHGHGNGTFSLALGGGTATGDYLLTGQSSGSLNSDAATGQADAVAAIAGSLQGTAALPILQPTTGHATVTGSVTVNGFSVPINEELDFAPDDILSSNLVITSSSCTYASGTWAQEIKTAIQSSGGNLTSFQGSWAARYVGGGAFAADAALTDLLDRGETLLSSWLDSGTFDADAMETLMVDAEHYAATGPKNDACGTRGDWASPLGGLLQRMLTAIANSPSTTAEALRFGIAAGLRGGELPSVGDDPLEGQLQTKAQELLDLAISSGSTTDVTLIAMSADSMGWTDISTQAAEALGATS